MNDKILAYKNTIIQIGALLWSKDLVTGLNGNMSTRVDENTILITAHSTCLGLLKPDDILLMDMNGAVIGEGQVSSEKLLHLETYKKFPKVQNIVHTHTVYTNAYFINNDTLQPQIFESKIYLGDIQGVPQLTPAVTNVKPVLEALTHKNIAVLKNHGVVSIGDTPFDCFLLIQALEEAAKIRLLSRLFNSSMTDVLSNQDDQKAPKEKMAKKSSKTYNLFSQEQIDEIVRVVNRDEVIKKLGHETDMSMDLAVKLDETGQIYSFKFNKGVISDVGHSDKVEFVINASEDVWRAVFNQEIDPFVATTQKKMHLEGDFAKISRWYAPCSRLFELWAQVPVA